MNYIKEVCYYTVDKHIVLSYDDTTLIIKEKKAKAKNFKTIAVLELTDMFELITAAFLRSKSEHPHIVRRREQLLAGKKAIEQKLMDAPKAS